MLTEAPCPRCGKSTVYGSTLTNYPCDECKRSKKALVKRKLPAAMSEQDDLGGWHIWASPGRPHDIGFDEIYEELAWTDAWRNLSRG